jgi:pimeloyl-ACP methyl ester carboxylesterase
MTLRIPARENSPALCADDGGSGDLPIIFVHSLAGRASHWNAQLTHLRPDRRAVAFDLRGHGCSGIPENGDYSIAAMASDIGSVASALGLARFILIGHSSGGAVSIDYAASNPGQVAGLLLVDPASDARMIPKAQVSQLMNALESDAYHDVVDSYYRRLLHESIPLVSEKVLADLHHTPRETVTGVFRASLDYDLPGRFRQYRGPALSIVTPMNDAPSSLHHLVPDLPHIIVTDTGHWLQMDRPDEFNRIMDGFLASVPGKGSG